MILIEILLILMNYKYFLYQVKALYYRFLLLEQAQVIHEWLFLCLFIAHLVIVPHLILLLALFTLITLINFIPLITLIILTLYHHFVTILQVKLIIQIEMSFIHQSLKLYLILCFLLYYLLIDCKLHRIENLL